MRLLDTTLLSLAAAVLIIGVHQTMTMGLAHSYWILMLSSMLLLWYTFRKRVQTQNEEPQKSVKRSKKRQQRK